MPYRILVIEDDADIAHLLELHLQDLSYQVDIRADGQNGLDRALTGDYDLVILDQVWGYGHDGYEHTVNSHINRLRKKIERDPAHARYILTVWGVGYKFAEPGPRGGHAP